MKLKPTFVKTRNVRNFEVLMDGLAMAEGEGRFGLVFGQAGRGKTRTAQWYTAGNGCVYLRVLSIWSTSELDFLVALARELGVLQPPRRKAPCFQVVLDCLLAEPRAIILDEMEKLPPKFLGFVRDLADLAGTAIVFVGEEDLVSYLKPERRVMSRVFKQMEFEPVQAPDIVFYASDTAGLKLNKDAAKVLAKSSEGDFRLVRRDVLELAQMAQAKGVVEVDREMAEIAARAAFGGGVH